MLVASAIEKVRVGKFSISTSLLINAARDKNLTCRFLPEKVIHISNPKTSHYFKGTSLPCNNMVASRLACNKYFLRKMLKGEQIPAPRTIILRHPAAWQSVLTSSLRFPLVVKPISASHANGASLNITSASELQRAVERAFSYIRKNKKESRVLVEEFAEGQDLRLFVVGKKVVSVVKRDPAYVIGDGHTTIRQLIHIFNQEWRSPLKYDFPLCPIPIDSEVFRYLARENLTLNSILPEGEKAYLRWNANVSTGGRPIDITDQVHPRIKALAVRIAKISHLKIGGVDLLCKDPSSGDITAANISVLEINDSPGLDIHHFPSEGTGRDIASAILDYIFKLNTSQKRLEKEGVVTLLADFNIRPTVPIQEMSPSTLQLGK